MFEFCLEVSGTRIFTYTFGSHQEDKITVLHMSKYASSTLMKYSLVLRGVS